MPQGYPQAAFEGSRRGVEVAQELLWLNNQALTVTYLAMLQEFRADTATFRAYAGGRDAGPRLRRALLRGLGQHPRRLRARIQNAAA
ncbi:MAG: hypothetical protein U0641_09255 [Anaerolineae bacterium]